MSRLLRGSRVLSIVFGLLAIVPFTLFAQVPQNLTEAKLNALPKERQQRMIESMPPSMTYQGIPANTPGTVNCFDYYTFGSVQVDAAPTLEQALPGVPLTFTGVIQNSNPYPVVDGQVWVKIFKKDQTSEVLAKQNGYPLVDFFLAKSNIVIDAKGEQEVTFVWDVPGQTQGGEYETVFYFTSAYRYNLLGLSFTDDVTGNKAPFKVTSDKTVVTLNKNAVALNDTLFQFAAPPPHFSKDELVTTNVELVNPSDEQRIVEVTWVTSKWDGILDSNEVKRETSAIVLSPREVKKVSYIPPLVESSVTFLQAIVDDRGAKSILHMRFVRDGFEESRINFPSITKYPLKANEENTIFSCLHSTNLPIIANTELRLTLKDMEGRTVHTYTYAGDITGDMMGLKDSFVPSEDLSSFTLTATLLHNGKLIDEVTQTYDCEVIDSKNCAKKSEIVINNASHSIARELYIGGVCVSILVAIKLYMLIRRKRLMQVSE